MRRLLRLWHFLLWRGEALLRRRCLSHRAGRRWRDHSSAPALADCYHSNLDILLHKLVQSL